MMERANCRRGSDASKKTCTLIQGTLGMFYGIGSTEDKMLEAGPDLGVYNSLRHRKDFHFA